MIRSSPEQATGQRSGDRPRGSLGLLVVASGGTVGDLCAATRRAAPACPAPSPVASAVRGVSDAPNGRPVAAIPLVLRGCEHPTCKEGHQQVRDHGPPGAEDSREDHHDEYGDQQHPHPPDVREAGRVDLALVTLRCPYGQAVTVYPVHHQPPGLQQEQRDREGEVHAQGCATRPRTQAFRLRRSVRHGRTVPSAETGRMSMRTQLAPGRDTDLGEMPEPDSPEHVGAGVAASPREAPALVPAHPETIFAPSSVPSVAR